MSADKHQKCPKCFAALAAVEAELLASYGKIPVAAYAKLQRTAERLNANTYTLEEYIDVGIHTDGNFYIAFSANCSECGFSFTYDHTQPAESKRIPPPGPRDIGGGIIVGGLRKLED